MNNIKDLNKPRLITKQYTDAIDQILSCIQERRYAALLGPRFSGKTAILEDVLKKLAYKKGSVLVKINLYDLGTNTNTLLFDGIARLLVSIISRKHKFVSFIDFPDEFNSATFRGFIQDLLLKINNDVILVLDHLEALPRDITHSLLTSLRAQYMEQQIQQFHLIVIVSGALSLAVQATGETSPFHNIATRIIIKDLSKLDSENLLNFELNQHKINLSANARMLFLESVQGDVFLIQELINKSITKTIKSENSRLNIVRARKIIDELYFEINEKYPLFQEALQLVEDDPDLLQSILILLERGEAPRAHLPISLFPDIDPLDLTSLVQKIGNNQYMIRNELYKRFLIERLNPGRAGSLFMAHGKWDIAIYYLEKSVKSGDLQYRPILLETILNAMYGSDNVNQSAYYMLNGLEVGFGIEKIKIWMKSESGTLRLIEETGFSQPTIPQEIPVSQDTIEGRVFREKISLREQKAGKFTKIIFPLISTRNEAVGLACIYDYSLIDRELDIQLYSYLNRAARALSEAKIKQKQSQKILHQDTQIQRKAEILSLLHQVSTLVQTITDMNKALHLILTVITAHFGLRFNRAWVFYINESGTQLDGQCAIGELTESAAHNAWERFSNRTFQEYIEDLLSTEKLKPTEIDIITRGIHMSVLPYFESPFSYVLKNRRAIKWLHDMDKYGIMPSEFQQHFDLHDAIITPLLASKDCVGLLVVDNKFTNRPTDNSDEELLATFANLVAMAVVQDRKRHSEQSRLEISETFREISGILSSSLNINKVLELVLDQMSRLLPFDTASIQWIDDDNKCLQIIRAKGFKDNEFIQKLSFSLEGDFPNVEVIHTKEVRRYDDVQQRFEHFSDPGYGGENIRSWMGVPLVIEDHALGVITVDNSKIGVFTKEHESIAIILATQAAFAIENAKLYSEEAAHKNYLDNLIQSSLDAIVAVDINGYVIEYNERAERLCGYSKSEVIDRRMKVEILYGNTKTPHEIQSFLHQSGKVKDFETTITNKLGQKIPILLSASQIFDNKGLPIGSVGFFEDQRHKLLAKDINEDIAHLQSNPLGAVLDEVAKRICAFTSADSVIIYPYRFGQKIYDINNIGTYGLMMKQKKISAKIRTEESMTGRLFKDYSERKLIVDDVSVGRDRTGKIKIVISENSFLNRERIGAFVALGLWLENKPVGALYVNYRSKHHWSNEELNNLEIFATQASVIIQQSKLIEFQQKEHRAIEALHSFVRLSNNTRSDKVWKTILKEGILVTKAQKGRILVWNQATENFVSKYQHGFNANEDNCFKNHNDSRSCSFLQKVIESKDTIMIIDTKLSSLPECCRDACGTIRSLLALPILGIKDDSIGILLLASDKPATFDEDDNKIMKSIVSSAGVMIENALNYQTIQGNNKLLEGLLRAFQGVTSHQDLQMVLQTITEGTLKAMHCDVVTLYTYDDTKGQFGAQPTIAGKLNNPDAPSALGYVSRDSVVWKVFDQGKIYYKDNTKNDLVLNNPQVKRVGGVDSFVTRENIISSAAIPLKIHNQNVGIFFVNYRSHHHFNENEINALQIFANEAAVAINDTKLYNQLFQRRAHLEAVYESSKIVTASVNRKIILDSILEQAVEKIIPVHGKKAIAGSLQIFDMEKKELVLESVYPSSEYDSVEHKIGKRMSVQRSPKRIFGITARAALERKPQNVGNVKNDTDYICYNDKTKSELAFPLIDGELLFGVLDIECDEENAFDDADVDAIQALAELSLLALKNAEDAQKMARINSIASMGAWGAELTHEMKSEIANIRRKTYNINKQLHLIASNSLQKNIYDSIQEIEKSIDNLKIPPMPRNLRDVEHFLPEKPACIDELISIECNYFRSINPNIQIIEKLGCGKTLARLHELWFGRILRHLLRNAIRSVNRSKKPQIIIRSERISNHISIKIEDNGTGILKEIESMLFHQPFPEDNEKSGHGLLIVRFLLEMHGGRIGISWNKPGHGVCFFFTLPVVKVLSQ